MPIARPALLLFLCCMIPGFVAAQEPVPTSAPAASDPQAVALIQRSLAALTGGAPVSDVTLTGTVRRIAGSDDETGTATLEATSIGDSRADLSFPSGNRSEIRNHSAVPLPGSLPSTLPQSILQAAQPVGAWSGPDGVMHGMASHNTLSDPAWFSPAHTLTNAATQNYVLSYVGQLTLSNGQSVVHISASRPAPNVSQPPPGPPGMSFAAFMQRLSQMDFYFDPSTSLPIALAFNTHPDGNALVDLPVWIQFSNYQSVGRVQVPMHVERYLNNNLVLDFQFTNAIFNSGPSATTFQLQ
jgi:hypothetical protein